MLRVWPRTTVGPQEGCRDRAAYPRQTLPDVGAVMTKADEPTLTRSF